jgi:hypothetical protein
MNQTLVSLAFIFTQLSLVAFGGGNTTLPEMHRQVVDVHHWMTGADFAALYALAQAAPGPNMMVAPLIGWTIAGWAGLLVTTLAIFGRLVDALQGSAVAQGSPGGTGADLDRPGGFQRHDHHAHGRSCLDLRGDHRRQRRSSTRPEGASTVAAGRRRCDRLDRLRPIAGLAPASSIAHSRPNDSEEK